jgi:hypothetical protein
MEAAGGIGAGDFPSDMSVLIPLIAAGVPALGAVGAAGVAAQAAKRSRTAEFQAKRILDLEKRLSDSRAKVFEPMVEAIGRLWDHIESGKPVDPGTMKTVALDDITRFAHWVQIYGSDDSVHATAHFMQASFNSAPSNILVRLMGELIIAARRELGYADTSVGPLESFGMRITDAYTDAHYRADLTDPLDVVFARYQWTPPWS